MDKYFLSWWEKWLDCLGWKAEKDGHWPSSLKWVCRSCTANTAERP
jgi:hypothetical protein